MYEIRYVPAVDTVERNVALSDALTVDAEILIVYGVALAKRI
jgi:hypothetical protein